jgi:cell division transport system permease protein
VAGALLAAGTVIGLRWAASGAASDDGPAGLAILLASIDFGPRDWATLIALPVAATMIATLTARASVLLSLARLP